MGKRHFGGISAGSLFIVLLAIAFIVLKLCGVISWSWIWVLSPLWFTGALTILAILVLVLIFIYLSR